MRRILTTLAIVAIGAWGFACGTEGDVDLDALGQSDEAIEFLDADGVPCVPDVDTWVAGNDSPDGPQDGTGSQSGSGTPGEDCDGSGEAQAESDRPEVHGRGCDAYGCCGVPAGSMGEGGSGSDSGGSGGGGSGSGSGGGGSDSGSGGGGSGSGSGGGGSGSGSGGGGSGE